MNSTIKRKTCSETGCTYPVWARGKCKMHDPKKPKAINPMSEKKKVEIAEDNKYYQTRLWINYAGNRGKVLCDNCDHEIPNPSGRNVCHIVSKGADASQYHNLLNSFVLGKGEWAGECNCGEIFDNQPDERKKMRIYPEFLRRQEIIKQRK